MTSFQIITLEFAYHFLFLSLSSEKFPSSDYFVSNSNFKLRKYDLI